MPDVAKSPARSPLMRVLRGTVTLTLTLGVLAGAGFAVQRGATILSTRAEAAAPPPAAAPVPVEVRPVVMEDGYRTIRRFLGQIEARQVSALSFEEGGRVVEILVDEGQHVAEGDVIARLDTRILETELVRLEAARAALAADLGFAERSVDRREALESRGFSPEEALDQARFSRDALAARIDETDALIETTRVRLDKAVIRAPYSGQVAARSADSGSTLGAGQTVVELMEDGPAQLRVGLPLWLAAEAGDRFEAEIAGRRFTATLSALRPDVDPATRTRTALLDVEGTDAPFGATATLVVPRTVEARGAWAPIEALREGAPGVWSVLVVDGESIVRAAPVEVLHAEADRVFLAGGLSNGLSLVTGGPHRVVPGQHVARTDAATSAEN